MNRSDKKLKRGSFLGACRIKKLIGHGAMSETYEARDDIRHRRVAVKVITSDYNESNELVQRFNSVGQAFARLNHQNVAAVHGLGEESNTHFVTMEFVEGQNFYDLVKAKGFLTVTEALPYVKQVLEGLRAIHEQGIVHQDIKSKNIILRDDGVVKIVDFGIGKIEGKEFVGAVNYLAPEVIRGNTATVQSDIWSLGINIYELVKGKKPFEADDGQLVAQKILNDELSFGDDSQHIEFAFQRIILRMCDKSLGRRYKSVTEILRDLRAFEAGEALPAAASLASLDDATMVLENPYLPPSLVPPGLPQKENTFPSLVIESEWDYQKIGLAIVVAVLLSGVFMYKHFVPAEPVMEEASSALTSPESPAEGQKMVLRDREPIQFVWSGPVGEDVYLEVSKNANFQDLILEEPFPSSPHLSQKSIGEGSYFWRLVEKNGTQSHAIFEPIGFIVVTQSPTQSIYPANRFISPEGKPIQFYWLNKFGVSHYRFQLSPNPHFESLTTDILLDGIQTGPLTVLPGDYYWRIRAEDPPSVTSLWSEVRSLRVQKAGAPAQPPLEAPLAANKNPAVPVPVVAAVAKKVVMPAAKEIRMPKLVAIDQQVILSYRNPKNPRKPANSDGVLRNPPVLRWSESAGAFAYKVQVARDSDFNQVEWTHTVSTLEARWETAQPGRYYWRVQATDGEVSSPYSAPSLLDLVMPAIPKAAPPPPPVVKKAAALKMPKEKERRKERERRKEKDREEEQDREEEKITFVKKKTPVKKEKTYAVAEKAAKAARRAVANASPEAEALGEVPYVPSPPAPIAPPPQAAEPLPTLQTPKLKLPPNGVSIVSLNGAQDPISFRWDTVNSAEVYRLQVAADAKFRKQLFTTTTQDNQFVVTKKMPKGQIFWRVRAEQSGGNSNWSKVYSFEISK
jgi:serine/threonine protein kinase